MIVHYTQIYVHRAKRNARFRAKPCVERILCSLFCQGVPVTVPPILLLAVIYLSALAEATPGLPGITRPHRRGCDASERGGPDALRLPPMSPPHTPCSPSTGAVAWPPTSLPTPVRAYRTLSPLTGPRPGGTALCCRLASHATYVTCAPAYGFAGRPSIVADGRGVGKFLWRFYSPATAHYKHACSSP